MNFARQKASLRRSMTLAAVVGAFWPMLTFAQLSGELGAHDPSTLFKQGSNYYYFATGNGIAVRTSANRVNWNGSASVFPNAPAWTTQAVPSFTGNFWAPDVAYFNGLYHLYYSVSSWGTIDSAIGVATSPSLTNAVWTDRGKVVQSDATWDAGPNTDTTTFNAIDPSMLVDADGKVYMAFGSYSSGILVTEIEPATGKRKNTGTLSATMVANNAGGGWGSSIEGSALVKKGSYYYLFVNYGDCCAGVDSTYDIRVGRSTSPTGPFFDQTGVDMVNGGGTLFLDDDGRMIGPGHFSFFSEGGQDAFGYHFYNGDANGAPTYGLRNLYWTADAWPSYAAVNPRWTSAASALWSNAGNWGGGTLPDGVGHVVNFAGNSFNRYLVGLDGVGRTVSSINFQSASGYTIGSSVGKTLTLDAHAGDMATLNVSDGNHTIAAPIVAFDVLGVNVTPATRSLTLSGRVSGTSLMKYGAGTLAITGPSVFSGNLLLRRGTLNLTGSVDIDQYASVGAIAGDDATWTVRGSGRVTAKSDLNIGDTGSSETPATGTLELRDSASVTVGTGGAFVVGSGFNANTEAVGVVNQSGGVLTANGAFDGAFIIGGRGSSRAVGTYNLSGGTVNANTNVRVGGRGSGTFIQAGGTFNVTGFVAIGRYAGATGDWTLSAGSLQHSNSATRIIIGESGRGTLTLDGSGQVTTLGTLTLGANATGSGTLHLNGGTLSAPSLARGAGSGTIYLDGGTLRATATQSNFLQNLTNVFVRAGGAVIDTQAHSVGIVAPLLHEPAMGTTLDGGLAKFGSGTLTLGSSGTFSGTIHVAQGSLVFASSQGTRRALSIASGASAVIDDSGTHVVSLTQLQVAAGATFDLNDNTILLSFNGALQGARAIHEMASDGRLRAATSVPSSAVGVAALRNLGLSSWNGVASPNGGDALLVRAAIVGDADFNGRVDFSDLLRLAQHYQAPIAANDWSHGDFDLDGAVSFNDLLGMAQNYGAGVSAQRSSEAAFMADWTLASSLVPEPSLAASLTLAGMAVRRRRSHNKSLSTNV
jgi:arabinan endo-1,5-alpha-L-arabinosidase